MNITMYLTKIAKLTEQKQDYFVKNIDQIHINKFLFDILKMLKKEKCILWTSCDKRRAESIIEAFDLRHLFDQIIFSAKQHIFEDINHICSQLNCVRTQILVFENDVSIAQTLSENHIACFLYIQPQL